MRSRSSLALWLANLAGLAGFVWPLLIAPTTRTAAEGRAHATDAPVLIALVLPLLILVAIEESKGRGSDARLIALLGALVAVNAILRIPKGPSGESLVFVLPILAGWWIGGRFAFLLGSFSILVSAVLTGGVGPWLPFQMFATGWVGMGAAGLRRLTAGRAPVTSLTLYSVGSSIVYGFLLTLWFWPFLISGSSLAYAPGLGFVSALRRYSIFWAATSLPWDIGRALFATLPAVALLARPAGALFESVISRFTSNYELDLEGEVRATV